MKQRIFLLFILSVLLMVPNYAQIKVTTYNEGEILLARTSRPCVARQRIKKILSRRYKFHNPDSMYNAVCVLLDGKMFASQHTDGTSARARGNDSQIWNAIINAKNNGKLQLRLK